MVNKGNRVGDLGGTKPDGVSRMEHRLYLVGCIATGLLAGCGPHVATLSEEDGVRLREMTPQEFAKVVVHRADAILGELRDG